MNRTIIYDYVEYGYMAGYVPEDTLYLDVGNSYKQGVIDHHHEGTGTVVTSASRMIWLLLSSKEKKELWPSSTETFKLIEQLRTNHKSIRIVLHKDPDLDAFVSSFILESYLRGTTLSSRISDVVELADQVDHGNFETEIFKAPNFYYVLEALKYEEKGRSSIITHQQYGNIRERFFKVLGDFVNSDEDQAAFLRSTSLYPTIETLINKVEDISKRTDNLGVKFPTIKYVEQKGICIESKEVLFIDISHDMAWLFNIYKARYRRGTDAIWVVRYPGYDNGRERLVLSVDYSEKYALFSYGWGLERLERSSRTVLADPRYPERVGPARYGYDGFDPWYDGRDKFYTIVDSPNSGTVLLTPDKKSLIQKLDENNEDWKRWRLDSFLDMLVRISARHNSIEKIVSEELDFARHMTKAMFDNIQKDKNLLHRFREGVLGFDLLIGEKLYDGDMFSDIEESHHYFSALPQKTKKIVGEILLTHSSFRVIDLICTLMPIADDSEKLTSYLQKNMTNTRFELITAAINLMKVQKDSRNSGPSLVRIAEYIELLRQLSPEDEQNHYCLWQNGITFLRDYSEAALTSTIGVDNPMLHEIRAANEKTDFLLKLYELSQIAGSYDESRVESITKDAHLDLSAREFLSVAVNFYEHVLQLGETQSHHSEYCSKKCPFKKSFSHKTYLADTVQSKMLSYSIYQRSIQRILGVQKSLSKVQEGLSGNLEMLSSLIKRAREDLTNVFEDDSFDYHSHMKDIINYARDDALRFIDQLESHNTSILDLIENGNDSQLYEKGEDFLVSLTIEQIYDRQDIDLRKHLQNFIRHGEDAVSKSLSIFRNTLKKPHKSYLQSDTNDQSVSNYLKEIYLKNYDNLIDIPLSYKVNVFSKLVESLQKRINLKQSARLIDAYFGRKSRLIGGLRNIISSLLFPLYSNASVTSLFNIWIVLIAGFAAGIFTASKGGFFWFTIGLSLYWVLFLLNLVFPNWHSRKREFDSRLERKLILGQMMPRFLVPMALSLSPFIMSDELNMFLYNHVQSVERFTTLIIIFGGLSLMALYKVCKKNKIGELLLAFATLWAQAFSLAYLIPIFLQNMLYLRDPIENSNAIAEMMQAKIAVIPRMIALFGYGNVTIYAFPAAALLFSFLCLFVAIFLEELGG